MFVNFPCAITESKHQAQDGQITLTTFALQRLLQRFQHFTIMELANAMESYALQWERSHGTGSPITPEGLMQAAHELRVHATELENRVAANPAAAGEGEPQ
jgi:hypothetical protein